MARFFLSKKGPRDDKSKFAGAWYLERQSKVKVKLR